MGWIDRTVFTIVANNIIGAKVLGWGALLYSSDLNSYQDPNSIDGYQYNPDDGNWYQTPPAPDIGQFGWENPASNSKNQELNIKRKEAEFSNNIENRVPDYSSIWDTVSKLFTGAQKSPYRGDPLTLDLNGDGLNTLPLKTPPLLFDINATGIKNSVGWVAPDDGLLVMDRNGNGVIDSGAELFGNNTPAYGTTANGKTVDGFAALAQEDTNHDGVVDAQDANFTSLRVWQDLNQDGISQSNELTTLDQQGIVSFNVGNTQNSQVLANGNQIANLGTFTRTDGSTGSDGTPTGMADINLAVDTFHSTFTDTVLLTAQAQALPDMQGSGMVRDLREAASLQTVAGQVLAAKLTQFANATTRTEQMALLDDLITAWGNTSGFADMRTRAQQHGYRFTDRKSVV